MTRAFSIGRGRSLGTILLVLYIVAILSLLPYTHSHIDTSERGGVQDMDPLDPNGVIDPVQHISDYLKGIEEGFIANHGQLGNDGVLFYAHGDPLSIGLTRDGLVFTLVEERTLDMGVRDVSEASPLDTFSFRASFLGQRMVDPMVRGVQGAVNNYLRGDDPAQWVTSVPSFSEVLYPSIYDGVDLRYYFKDGLFKYDLVLDPGVDPSTVVLEYDGVLGLSIDPLSGDLEIETPLEVLVDKRPVLFEGTEPCGEGIPGEYVLIGPTTVGFIIPEAIDMSRGVTIDPGLQYSTYVGGNQGEGANDMAIDEEGNVFITGGTRSPDFPTTPGAYQTDLWGTYDHIVVKLDPTLSMLLFSTYIGGNESSGVSECMNIEVVPNDGIYLTGYTRADDFPTTEDAMYPESGGNVEITFSKLSLDGSRLLYSTYIGGSQYEMAGGLQIDEDGSVYLGGATSSPEFPTTAGAFCETRGPELDETAKMYFIMKIDPSLTSIVASTFIAETNFYDSDFRTDLVIASDGTLYVGSTTNNPNFTTTEGAYCTTFMGQLDGVIYRMSPDLSEMLVSTFIGTENEDIIEAIEVTSDLKVLVSGYSESDDYPLTPDAFDKKRQSSDEAVVTVLDADLTTILFSSFLGGSSADGVHKSALAPDETKWYVSGFTSSNDLATTFGAFDPDYGGHDDQFLAVINLTGYGLDYLTYLGGDDSDESYFDDIIAKENGNVLMSGYTLSEDFPITSGAYQTSRKSALAELYIVELDPRPVPPPPAPNVTATPKNHKVVLEWELDVEWCIMKGYKVYRGTDPTDIRFIRRWNRDEPFVDGGLENGRIYYYQVSGENTAGEGDLSEVVSAMPLGRPTEPTLWGWSGDGAVHLNWTAPRETGGGYIFGYRVYWSETPSSEDFRLLKELGNVTSWNQTGLELGMEYYYLVVALNYRNEGDPSGIILVRVTDTPSPPLHPTVEARDSHVVLGWERPVSNGGSPRLGYQIYRASNEGEFELIAQVLPGTFEYTDWTAVNGVEYDYMILAFSVVGKGDPTETFTVTPLGRPSPPVGLLTSGGDGRVDLNWEYPLNDGGSEVTSYFVYGGRTKDSMLLLDTVSERAYSQSGLTNGDVWYYKVSANNWYGEGMPSLISMGIPLGYPGPPGGLVAETEEGEVSLIWLSPTDDGGANITHYQVLRRTTADDLRPLTITDPSTTSYTDTSVINGIEYYYAITAVTIVGEGPLSEVVTARPFGPPTSPQNISAKAGEGSIVLMWTAPESDGGHPITGYRILRGLTREGMVSIAEMGTSLTYSDDSVRLGTTYYYGVAARNEGGYGEPTVISKTYLSLPSEPLNLTLVRNGEKIVLSWDQPRSTGGLALTGYTILRGPNKDVVVEFKDIPVMLGFTDTTVVDGEGFWYSVRAVNDLGAGEEAAPLYIQVPEKTKTSGMDEISIWIVVLIMILIFVVVVGGALVVLRRGPPREPFTDEGESVPWHTSEASKAGRIDTEKTEETGTTEKDVDATEDVESGQD